MIESVNFKYIDLIRLPLQTNLNTFIAKGTIQTTIIWAKIRKLSVINIYELY